MELSQRLTSLDVFRGMTIMLMIIVNTPGSFETNYPLLEHSPWTGCTLADLVFPFFLFSVGLSGFLSSRKHGGCLTKPLLKKILRRTLLLFLLGILFNAFPFYQVEDGLSVSASYSSGPISAYSAYSSGLPLPTAWASCCACC